MTCGVEIYERQTVVLHSKTMVVDGRTSVVGSTNLDYRSIEYNCELSAVIRSRAVRPADARPVRERRALRQADQPERVAQAAVAGPLRPVGGEPGAVPDVMRIAGVRARRASARLLA